MEIKDLMRNPVAINEGDWVDGIPQLGDVRLKVRGLSSAIYRERLAAETRKVPVGLRDREGAPKVSEQIRIASKLMHEVILLDWDGITNDGKPVPYTKEQAKIWCTEERFRSFADAVVHAAQIVDNAIAKDEEEIVGN